MCTSSSTFVLCKVFLGLLSSHHLCFYSSLNVLSAIPWWRWLLLMMLISVLGCFWFLRCHYHCVRVMLGCCSSSGGWWSCSGGSLSCGWLWRRCSVWLGSIPMLINIWIKEVRIHLRELLLELFPLFHNHSEVVGYCFFSLFYQVLGLHLGIPHWSGVSLQEFVIVTWGCVHFGLYVSF